MESLAVLNFTTELKEDELPDVDYYATIIYLCPLIIDIIVMLFGVPGNCLILRVYWNKTRKTSTHVLIMALAWADLSVCILRPSDVVRVALRLANVKIPQILWMIVPFELISVSASVMITAVIAADRYDCVCRPHRRFFTSRRSKLAASAALALVALLSIPSFILNFTELSYRTLYVLLLVFEMIGFGVALMMIIFCYYKVYATIRSHARVGAAPRPTTGDEVVSKRDRKLGRKRSQSGALETGKSDTSAANQAEIGESKISAVGQAGTGEMDTPAVDKAGTDETVSTSINLSNSRSPRLVQDDSAFTVNRVYQDLSRDGKYLTEKADPKNGAQAEADPRALRGDRTPRQVGMNNRGHALQRVGGAVLQRKTTRMLFITSVVFLLTWLPYWIYVALWFGFDDPLYLEIFGGLAALFYINHAVNPLIYGLANRRFKKDCRFVLSKINLC